MDDCALYEDPDLYNVLFPEARLGGSTLDASRRQRLLASEAFYLDEARTSGGPVLEVACGSGRLTIPLAQAGFEIHGIDLSPSMLEAARSKAQAAHLTIAFSEADMRQFDLGRRFSTILIPGNSLLHLLTVDDLLQCFATLRRHLTRGGALVFDISKWDLELLVRDPAARYPVMRVLHPQRGEIDIEERASYNAATQIRDVTWFLSTPAQRDFHVIAYRLRVIFPQELPLLLHAAGFRLEARYGEFTRVPFDAHSPRQVCRCSLL